MNFDELTILLRFSQKLYLHLLNHMLYQTCISFFLLFRTVLTFIAWTKQKQEKEKKRKTQIKNNWDIL